MNLRGLICLLGLPVLVGTGCQRNQSYEYVPGAPSAPLVLPKAAKTYKIQTNLDVLMVIDNSGSMYSMQQELASNAKIVLDALAGKNATDIDWRMGFIATDYFERPLQYPVLDKKTNNLTAAFSDRIKSFGTSGSADEKPIRSAFDFLTKSPQPFIRPNAAFAMIILTDEDENSDGGNSGSMDYDQFYAEVLRQVGTESRIMTFGIINQSRPTPQARYTTTLKQAAKGLYALYDINSQNFSNEIDKLTKGLLGSLNEGTIRLGKPAVPESIRVFWGRNPVPPLPSGYWYYDPEVYSVVFTDLSFQNLPGQDPASQLTIDFDLAGTE